MSSFTRYVSRKVLSAVAIFAAVAVVMTAVVVAEAAGSDDSGSVDIASQGYDAEALDAALADPASVIDATDPADPSGDRQQLRADLKAARALAGDARRDALADIRDRARDGAYGSGIERRADRRQVRHELVFSLLPDELQTDLTALKDAPADERKQLREDILDRALAGDYGPDVQKAAEQLKELRQS
jgi:hypothetical protein